MEHNFTDANQKSGFAEGYIAKFRAKLERACTLTGRQDWTEHWQNILKTLNTTPQSRTGLAPADINEMNVGIIFDHKMKELEKKRQKIQKKKKNFLWVLRFVFRLQKVHFLQSQASQHSVQKYFYT